jgi:release factor glutamine methyltransferase
MTNSQSIQTTLSLAATQLKTQGIETETAKLEAQLLLQHVLNVNRAWLISHQNDPLESNIHAAYRALINRRLNGEPIAYILGVREFYGLNLKVAPATLIPRPDTETLVEAALAKIPQNVTFSEPSFPRRRESNLNLNQELNLNQKMDSRLRGNDEIKVLDLGTGSGAIALAIAKHRPQACVLALDASQAALDVAIENAQSLKISNVDFVLSDWFSALGEQNNTQKFDLIVSNPPYIEANDAHLSQGDLRFEPISALASGQDGLDDIRRIIRQAPQYLYLHGWLLLEHGYNQAELVAALFKQAGFNEISHARDLAGINRVTLGRLC